jgi:hypothetical protein
MIYFSFFCLLKLILNNSNLRIKCVTRDANSPAIFIPRGFEESGNGNLSSGKLKPIPQVSGSGFGGISGSILFQI